MKKYIYAISAVLALFFLVPSKANAQAGKVTTTTIGEVNFTVDEANTTKWSGFTHFEVSSHLLGTTGMGFSAGLQSQYKLPALPITLNGRFRYEIGGLGQVKYKGEAYGSSRNIELAALFPIIPGRKKEARVKVTTDYSASNTTIREEYFYADGQKKTDLLVRGGGFQYWTNGNFSSTGLSAGLVLRTRRHVKVSLKNEEGYYREVFTNSQVYVDMLYAPILTGLREDEGFNVGGRIGFLQAASDGMNYYVELEFRPGVIAAITFGWLFGWERMK
jgi:hypothetical protein